MDMVIREATMAMAIREAALITDTETRAGQTMV